MAQAMATTREDRDHGCRGDLVRRHRGRERAWGAEREQLVEAARVDLIHARRAQHDNGASDDDGSHDDRRKDDNRSTYHGASHNCPADSTAKNRSPDSTAENRASDAGATARGDANLRSAG
jgi:hypothetical protein